MKLTGHAQELDRLRCSGDFELSDVAPHIHGGGAEVAKGYCQRKRAWRRAGRWLRSLQMFAAVHASIYNLFNSERSVTSRQNFKLNRTAALAEWRGLCAE